MHHPLREICPKTKPYTLKLRKQEAQWPIQFPQNVLNIVLLIDVFLSITYLCNYFNYIRTCNYWYVFYQLTIKTLLLTLLLLQLPLMRNHKCRPWSGSPRWRRTTTGRSKEKKETDRDRRRRRTARTWNYQKK